MDNKGKLMDFIIILQLTIMLLFDVYGFNNAQYSHSGWVSRADHACHSQAPAQGGDAAHACE